MITPSYGLTATERVLPRLALDWTTGLAQSGVDVTRAGVATFVGSNGLIQSATVNTQRLDWSTGTSGLLVEEARTNTCLRSSDQTVSPWLTAEAGTATISTTQNYSVSPDGTTTATRVLMDLNGGGGSTANICWLTQDISVTSGVSYTFSFYVKTNDGTTKTILVRDDGAPATFNTLKTVTGDYQRITVTGTAASTAVARAKIWLRGGVGTSFDADLSVWGFQWETGAFPTSYIPTEATAVTRNADVASMTGTNFSDWYNQTEGTFEVDGDYEDGIANNTLSVPMFMATDGVSNVSNILEIRRQNSNGSPYIRMMVYAGNVAFTASNLGFSSGQPVKAAMGYITDNVCGAIDGNNPVVDSVATMPTGIDQLFIGRSLTVYMNGWIRSLNYWPMRLINREIQSISK